MVYLVCLIDVTWWVQVRQCYSDVTWWVQVINGLFGCDLVGPSHKSFINRCDLVGPSQTMLFICNLVGPSHRQLVYM